MEQFDHTPEVGKTNVGTHWNCNARPTGWRRASVSLVESDRLAEVGARAQIDKGRAVVAVKRVGAYIGLKAADLLLLDTLTAFTQAQDWEDGQRPIVWASNAYLMAQTGFSLSTLKRHARRLCDGGIIAFKDSSNGKRWGHRNSEGRIVEAYGFDLAPMAARAEEFEALAEQIAAERVLCQRLKRQITATRRLIRARIEAAIENAFVGPWSQLMGAFEGLLARLPQRAVTSEQLDSLLSEFLAVRGRVDEAYAELCHQDVILDLDDKKPNKMDPRGREDEPHILITNQLQTVTCNSSENEEQAVMKPKEGQTAQKNDTKAEQTRTGVSIDLNVVIQSCPEFAAWARDMGGYLKDWGDVHRVAGQLRPMVGVSEQAWAVAQDRLGPQAAAAALVLTFDKHCAGEVVSPGGYLRGMVEKAAAGALHLERSFYGRLNAQAA